MGRRGFTLLEIVVAMAIFAMVGMALKDTVMLSDHSQHEVFQHAGSNRHLREVSRRLLHELGATDADQITVTPLSGGNTEITFPLPIFDAGAPAWGVMEPGINGGAPSVGWQVRYTVDSTGAARLLRQVLDDTQVVQKSEVILEGLANDPAAPGFVVVQAGSLWDVSLRLAGSGGLNENGRQANFQVRTRN